LLFTKFYVAQSYNKWWKFYE